MKKLILLHNLSQLCEKFVYHVIIDIMDSFTIDVIFVTFHIICSIIVKIFTNAIYTYMS